MEIKYKISNPRIPVLNFHPSVLKYKPGTFLFPSKKNISTYSLHYCDLHRLRFTVTSGKKLHLLKFTPLINFVSGLICNLGWQHAPYWGETFHTCSTRNFRGTSVTDRGKKVMSKIQRDKCLLGFKWGIRHSIFCFHQALIFLCPGGENIHYYWLLSKVHRM